MSLKKFWSEYYEIILIAALAAFLFIWKIGSTPILDGDTAFYAQIAKNIIKSGNWLTMRFISPTDIIDKPPLVMWLMALSYKIFGVNELAVSLWHSICAVLTIILTYILARELFSRRCAFITSLVLLTCGQFFYQSRSPLQDMPLTLFILGAFVLFMIFDRTRNPIHLYLSAVSVGLATLTKGPVGLVIPAAIIFLHVFINWRFKVYSKIEWLVHLPIAVFIFLLVTLPWFIQQYMVWGKPFLDVFFLHNFGRFFHPTDAIAKSSLIAPQYDFYSYVLQLFILIIPWSGFLYPAIWFFFKKRSNHKFRTILIFALTVLAFFSFSLNYKISRYILPAIPILALMIGKLLNDYIDDPSLRSYINWSILLNFILVIPALFVGVFFLITNFPEAQAAYQPIILPPAAILAVGMLISNLVLMSKYKKGAIAGFFITGLIGFGLLVPLTDAYFIKANPIKNLSLKIKTLASNNDKAYKYLGSEDTIMTFYIDRPVSKITDQKTLEEKLKYKSRHVFVVCDQPDALKSLRIPIKLIEKQNNYVLFSN